MDLKIIVPDIKKHYHICPSCSRPILLEDRFYYSDELKTIICPFCLIEDDKWNFAIGNLTDNNDYEWIIRIEFGKSKSKKYKKAKILARKLPNYNEINGNIFCGTKEIREYCINHEKFEEITSLIHGWKSSKVFYFDKEARFSIDHFRFVNRLLPLAKEYSPLLSNDIKSKITFEELPLPFVHHPSPNGAFIGFSEGIDTDIFFCECQKEAIENYLAIRKLCPLANYTNLRTNPLDGMLFPEDVSLLSKSIQNYTIKYKPHLCYKCNHVIPKNKNYLNWYYNQEYFNNGIDPTNIRLGVVLQDKCSAEISNALNLELKLLQLNDSINGGLIERNIIKNGSISTIIMNKVLNDFGFRGIGEYWINETTLKHIVESLFPDCTVISHYRPKWLLGLELDIYVSELKLAFEYQGIQHFYPIQHWGGVKQLKIQQEHDARKKQICDELGVTLVYFDYTEDINTEYVKTKITTHFRRIDNG